MLRCSSRLLCVCQFDQPTARKVTIITVFFFILFLCVWSVDNVEVRGQVLRLSVLCASTSLPGGPSLLSVTVAIPLL